MKNFSILTAFLFSTLFIIISFSPPAKAQVHNSVQLVPCFNCQLSEFEHAAKSAMLSGPVYVFNNTDKEIRAFRVVRHDEPGGSFVNVLEVDTDPLYENALSEVLALERYQQSSYRAENFNSLEGMGSALELAAINSLQRQLGREYGSSLLSSVGEHITHLVEKTLNSNKITQALNWGSTPAIRITFPDGSYIELKYKETLFFRDGTEIDIVIEYEVNAIVDSQGNFVGETRQEFSDRRFSGSERYISNYRSLVSRLGFAINQACNSGVGGAQPNGVRHKSNLHSNLLPTVVLNN